MTPTPRISRSCSFCGKMFKPIVGGDKYERLWLCANCAEGLWEKLNKDFGDRS